MEGCWADCDMNGIETYLKERSLVNIKMRPKGRNLLAADFTADESRRSETMVARRNG